MENIYLKIISEIEAGNEVVLGTLIKTRGSTPQVPGSSAIFNADGLISGTLGGGVLEAEALKLAGNAVKTKTSSYNEFSLNASIDDKAGAICGGSAVYILDSEPANSIDVFFSLRKSLENQTPGILISIVEEINKRVVVKRNWIEKGEKFPCDFYARYGLKCKEIERVFKTKSPFLQEFNQGRLIIFAEPLFPDPQLIIVGAGHVGKALCQLAEFTGFNVTIIDNRPELATKERFPKAGNFVVSEIDNCFENIKISTDTYIVIVTQGHREDSLALKGCIHSNAAYVGMIGSKRKVAQIREKFISKRICTESDFDKIYAPVGLKINSVTVEEIALSIVAQLVQVKNRKPKKETWCMILAAGESKRMKQQKLLMPYQEKTIIETIVEKSIASVADNVLLVTGSHREKIEALLKPYHIQTVENENYKNGMFSSVLRGINSIPENVNAVVILLGDQPMVETRIIDHLIQQFNKTQKEIIIPVFNGKRGHPVLINLKLRKEINSLSGNKGLRELMEKFPEKIYEVEVDSEEILKDLDTPEDYKKTIK